MKPRVRHAGNSQNRRPSKRVASSAGAYSRSYGSTPRRVTPPSATLICVLVLSCVSVSSILAFGNPVLWVTADQHLSAQYSDTANKSDYQFIESVAGEQGDTSQIECLGEYKAVSQDSDENRAVNIELAAQALEGWEIKPGETFSMNEVLGDTSKDERYQIAAIVGGTTLEQGRGGGVCQVSTALYIAALKANMEIVERTPHTIVSDYAPIGLDATLSYGEIDLCIKNNFDTSVFIRATALGQTVDVGIYGKVGSSRVEVDATSKITNRFDIPAGEVYSDPESMNLSSDYPVTFYEAQAFRVEYRDGVLESSTLLSADTYQVAVQSNVEVGKGSVDPSK